MRATICDTSFWIAAFDERENRHALAATQLTKMRGRRIVTPWPIIYEVLRTRTVANPRMVQAFERAKAGSNVLRLSDVPFRDECLAATFRSAAAGRAISLVDMVIRAVLGDRRIRITELLTFNPGDFFDVCRERDIRIWPDG